jgi:endonuclease YncB( thermonuclease family)
MTTLEETNWKNTIEFVPLIIGGKVIKVYDSDTITIATQVPYNPILPESKIFYRFSIRLKGIDAPEIRTSNEDEKYVATLAQKELEKFILNKYVKLKNTSNDKYGRILADVYTEDDIFINKWILDNRFGVEYNGLNKNSPKSWTEYYNKN